MSDAASTTGDAGFSPTVRWKQPDTKLSSRPEFDFNAAREKANADRAAANKPISQQTPAGQLYSEMWGHRLFNLDAIKFLVRQFSALIEKTNRLEAQVDSLQQQLANANPPHLRKHEKRTA
jgi:hypothetical protein